MEILRLLLVLKIVFSYDQFEQNYGQKLPCSHECQNIKSIGK